MMLTRCKAQTALVLLLTCLPLPAQLSKARAELNHVHVQGRMRFFYTISGQHAVDQTDANANRVPDQVEDIATQTQGAWLLLIEGLGFPDPFQGERFREAKYLDVHLINKEVLKSNGVAYDEIQRFNKAGDPPGTGSLSFNVATSVFAPRNLTPAHELFHIIQNGACYFKNPWYAEGTARWSEKALGLGGAGAGLQGRWPPADELWEKLDDMSYNAAAQFWDPLAKHVDVKGVLPDDKVPEAVRDMTYVNGEPVLKDMKLHGWEIIRKILWKLSAADDLAARERHLDRWSEKEQRSSENTAYIRKVIEEVRAEQNP